MTTATNYALVLAILLAGAVLGGLRAQSAAGVDSLWRVYRTEKEPTSQLDHLNEIAVLLIRQKPDSTLVLAKQIERTAKELNYIKGQVNALVLEADVQSSRGQTKEAEANFALALALAQKDEADRRSLLRVYNSRGVLYQRTARLKEAFADFNEGIKLASELKELRREGILRHNLALALRDNGQHEKALVQMKLARTIMDDLGEASVMELAMVVNSLGTLYQSLDQFEQAKDTYQEMLHLSERINNPTARLIATYNIGTILEEQDSFGLAMEKYQQSLDIAIVLKQKKYEGTILDAMGNVSKSQGLLTEAGRFYSASLYLRTSMDDLHGQAVTLKNQADLLIAQSRFQEAVTKAAQSYEIGQKAELPKVMMESSGSLHKAYWGLKDHAKAYQMLLVYDNLKDSLRKEEMIKQLNAATADKQMELEEQGYKTRILEIEKKNEKQRNRVLLIALAIVGVLSMALFIANRMRLFANRQLKEKNEALKQNQHRLEDSNINLQSSNQQLEIANNKLQQFAFATSHDLKESLRAITSFGELARKMSEKEHPEIAPHLERVVEGGKRMNKTLEKLMQYANIGPDPSSRQLVDLEDLVLNVQNSLNPELMAVGAKPVVLDLPHVHAQVVAMDQLFRNLIDNAIRYRHPERPCWIEIGSIQKQGQDTVFYVKDNGIGIAAEYLDRIFQPFFRLHAPDKSGSGLGLAICKRIVSVYHGRIWANAQVDEGTTIFFTLPSALDHA